MDRIAETFAQTRKENRAAFIAYVCAGDPDAQTSLEVCRALLQNGVDVLELGVPFSDPLADGKTNQLAAQRALEAGTTHEQTFALVKKLREEFPDKPIVFYTYYNIVYSTGEREYLRRASEAGLDGLLTLDLPPEEASSLLEGCREYGLKNIFIIAPTTPPERIQKIAQAASGFIYYVSREGVTGVREDLPPGLDTAIGGIREHTQLPVVVGFGISSSQQVQAVGAVADGVVVGSALVNVIAEHAGVEKRKDAAPAIAKRMQELLS